MSQVIAVRFIDPASGERVFGPSDRMTQANTHHEAIELALDAISGGVARLLGMQVSREQQWAPAGANSHWQTHYVCTLDDDEYPRQVNAILFAQYKV